MITFGIAAALLGVLGSAAIAWARRHLLVVRVEGASMEPTLSDGSRILVRRADGSRVAVRTGDLVLLRMPAPRAWGALVVKRVAAVAGEPVPPVVAVRYGLSGCVVPDGSLVVLGDNPLSSLDSRHFGPVPYGSVVGVARRSL